MNQLEVFNEYRTLLFAIAYRMLSRVADAEDILQEAWLRWQKAEAVVKSPKAYLSKLVVRLCIDYLRTAQVRREQYVGLWLPEPLMTQNSPNALDHAELAESLSVAFLTLLECLSPPERAIFLLRDVFAYDYAEIAKIVDKSVPNCRQIAHRARQHLVLRKPTISLSSQQQEQLAEQFLESWNRGDVTSLVALMAEDIAFQSDGGGQGVAARRSLSGHLKVARFLVAIRRSKLLPSFTSKICQVNGQPGIVNSVNSHVQSVFSFEFADERIQSIFAVVNPEKLKAVQP